MREIQRKDKGTKECTYIRHAENDTGKHLKNNNIFEDYMRIKKIQEDKTHP